jgi:hypothetical protein
LAAVKPQLEFVVLARFPTYFNLIIYFLHTKQFQQLTKEKAN